MASVRGNKYSSALAWSCFCSRRPFEWSLAITTVTSLKRDVNWPLLSGVRHTYSSEAVYAYEAVSQLGYAAKGLNLDMFYAGWWMPQLSHHLSLA